MSYPDACASVLLRLECLRTIDQRRVDGGWSFAEVAAAVQDLRERLESVEMIPLSDEIIERACQPFAVSVGSLDAIHLASALTWSERRGEPLHFLTHDRRLGIAARASGLEASGFLERG